MHSKTRAVNLSHCGTDGVPQDRFGRHQVRPTKNTMNPRTRMVSPTKQWFSSLKKLRIATSLPHLSAAVANQRLIHEAEDRPPSFECKELETPIPPKSKVSWLPRGKDQSAGGPRMKDPLLREAYFDESILPPRLSSGSDAEERTPSLTHSEATATTSTGKELPFAVQLELFNITSTKIGTSAKRSLFVQLHLANMMDYLYM
ncbi:hypothetical protein BC830DRAFT_118650, partial [Chytriomyces sp. MP71]